MPDLYIPPHLAFVLIAGILLLTAMGWLSAKLYYAVRTRKRMEKRLASDREKARRTGPTSAERRGAMIEKIGRSRIEASCPPLQGRILFEVGPLCLCRPPIYRAYRATDRPAHRLAVHR